MGHQEFRQFARVDPVGLAHAREKGGHGTRFVAGAGEDVDSDSVGLFFIGAGEVDLLLDQGGLPANGRGSRGIAADCGSERDGSQQDGRVRNGHLAGGFPGAQEMLLGDVRDFVREYGRQFTLGLGGQQQAGVYADVAPGTGKRIDLRIVDKEEGERCPTRRAVVGPGSGRGSECSRPAADRS